MAEKIIVELGRDQLELIAALTHFWLRVQPEDKLAESVISDLQWQTNCVHSDPQIHGIGRGVLLGRYPTPASQLGEKIERAIAIDRKV